MKEETRLIDLLTAAYLQRKLTSHPGTPAQQWDPQITRLMMAVSPQLVAESSEEHSAEETQMRNRLPLVYIQRQTLLMENQSGQVHSGLE